MKRHTIKTLFHISVLTASAAVALPALAEAIPGTGLSLHLESAQIVGTGRTINLHRVPVVDMATGATQHYDVTMDFSLDENGELVFDTLASRQVSQPLSIANFIAGTYKGTEGNTYILSGPAHVGGTRTAWALVCSECRATMSWATGSPLGHPDIGARPISAELPGGFSYGVFGQESEHQTEFRSPRYYRSGQLISARQVGKSLTVYLFNDRGTDVSTAMGSVTLLLEQPENPPPSPAP
jgi:hypothetical protein